MAEKTVSDRVEVIENSIKKAAVQCYALEGGYPPGIEYLQKHYGLLVDESKYFYHYEAFASNIIPIIKVFRK
jgi:hypothetical protein